MFHHPSRYKIIAGPEGNRYQFFCDLSGALLCTSEPVFLDRPEQELMFAWESEGKKHFNKCQRCGRWTSDTVYNAETLECVECSPWEEEPQYCPHCGERVRSGDVFCGKCKNRLRYGMNKEENGSRAGQYLNSEEDKTCTSSSRMQGPEPTARNATEKRGEAALSDLYALGYGPKAMMESKVCNHCGNTEAANRYTCSKCKKRLPDRTIYQIYQQKHTRCRLCDAVLASYMRYCPHCGMQIQ